MRAAMIAALLTASAAPAWAELPPYVYEQARAEADTVMIVNVDDFTGLADEQAEGTCVVQGVVADVQRGDRHAVGDAVSIDAPCVGPTYQPMPGPFPGYDARWLKATPSVLVFLKDGDLVLRGLEQAPSMAQ